MPGKDGLDGLPGTDGSVVSTSLKIPLLTLKHLITILSYPLLDMYFAPFCNL